MTKGGYLITVVSESADMASFFQATKEALEVEQHHCSITLYDSGIVSVHHVPQDLESSVLIDMPKPSIHVFCSNHFGKTLNHIACIEAYYLHSSDPKERGLQPA